MPEMLKATSTIVGYGMKDDIAFLTDGRFSGGSHGFVIGHVAPEAYIGGNIALIQDGDVISICADTNKIELHVNDDELLKRKEKWTIPENVKNNIHKFSNLNTFRKLVSQADDGCIF